MARIKKFRCGCAITTKEILELANDKLARDGYDENVKNFHVLNMMHLKAQKWLDIHGTTRKNPWLPTHKIGLNYIYDSRLANRLLREVIKDAIARQSKHEWEIVWE